jgi:hypothetical protein
MSKFGWSYPAGAANDPNAPYNQEEMPIADLPIPEQSIVCPACGETAEWHRETTEPGPFNDLTSTDLDSEGWHCAECDWEQECEREDYENQAIYDEKYKDRLNEVKKLIAAYDRRVSNAKTETITLESIFEHAPDGDFVWEGECGDWSCYDDDGQWCLTGYYEVIKRENGKRSVELWTCDLDGSDCSGGWEEGEDWDKSDCPYWFQNNLSDYFRNWAEYWLDCFYTRKDVLDQMIGEPKPDWHEFCLKAAENEAKYLELRK